MNRYSNERGSNNGSWRGNNNSISRGSSGFGNSRGRGNEGGNPLGNWINRRRRRHGQSRHNSQNNHASRNSRRRDGSNVGSPVGTEKKALQNIKNNARHFKYPEEGFVTPIEHSLLYAMIEFPENYPESVVRSMIEEEDFEQYLWINEKIKVPSMNTEGSQENTRRCSGGAGTSGSAREGQRRNAGGESGDDSADRIVGQPSQEESDVETESSEEDEDADEGNDQAQADSNVASGSHSSHNAGEHSHQADSTISIKEQRASYAQLSAILALSAEKTPAQPSREHSSTQPSRSKNSNTTNGLSSNHATNSSNGSTRHVDPAQPLSIGQTLCRKLLRIITSYSDSHDLDRNSEIREFLSPIEKRCAVKNEREALKQLLPAYVGYTISLVTGNPLPLLVGAAVLAGNDPMTDENANVSGFKGMGGRVGNMETTGLLDECEWEDE